MFTKGDPLFSDRRVDYDLFHIFYDMAETADNYASNDVHGETTSNGHRNVDSDYEAIRNGLVPHSISKIAALIQLFWDRTHASPNVDVILIIDSSGSMGSNDRYNKRLDAARTYLTASVPGDYVGVVDFDSYANLVGPLQHAHDNKEALTTAIETINSSGGTNIGAGIQLACDTLLASTSGNTEKAAILLTDGNGSFSGEDTCFADQRWPIYTFGFGSANDTLLRDISMRTGGEFRRLDTSSFICKFQAVRTKIASGVPGECNSDNISPLETIKHLFTVPKVQLQLTVSTSWLGSDVELSLVSPSGRVINRDTVAPDVVHDLGATFESYTVSNPEAGEWEMILYGADIPEGGEEVVFNHTTVPIPASDLGAIIIKKRAPYDVEESFDFTGDLGSFAIKHKETASFDRLAAGEYMVKELVPDGWNLDVVECGDSNVAVVDDGVKIKLDAGDSVTCIFRNSKTAKVTIGKRAPEGVDKKFRFAGDLGTFGLRHKETKVFENVAAGEYVVTEVERAGWRMESVDCRNADVAIAANGVKIKLDEGEKVLCTFLNSPADFHGSIFMPMVSGQ